MTDADRDRLAILVHEVRSSVAALGHRRDVSAGSGRPAASRPLWS